MKDLKFDLNDIVLVPVTSDVNSRSECDVETQFSGHFDGRLFTLPLMAAPMDTVVCEKNVGKYIREGIIPCIPRGVNVSLVHPNLYFKSFGLAEIEDFIHRWVADGGYHLKQFPNVLIDMANGHMSKLITIVKHLKTKYPEMVLMVGNIANPETFADLGLAGADYVRCSIGTGAGCTTAANASVNYPLGSLISECHEQKKSLGLSTKIVADGGMRNYSDIINALALGADYVMVGSIFNVTNNSFI